jgi:hypothetical protein
VTSRAKPPRADHDLGIHTTRPVQLFTLDITSENAVHGNRYEPTPYGVLEDLLLEIEVDPPATTFVDLGSGKGRIVCLAATFPFRRVIGVEFASGLHKIAESNIAALPAGKKKAREVRSVCMDAADYRLPGGPLVLFMFNPFNVQVISRVIGNVERSFSADPREIWILYYMPVHEAVLESSRLLAPVRIGYDFAIYRTRPDQT